MEIGGYYATRITMIAAALGQNTDPRTGLEIPNRQYKRYVHTSVLGYDFPFSICLITVRTTDLVKCLII